MKTIKINAYNYQDLSDDSKINVKIWLDEMQITELAQYTDYPSDWPDEDINEHCISNKYLFDKYGKCIHNLQVK